MKTQDQYSSIQKFRGPTPHFRVPFRRIKRRSVTIRQVVCSALLIAAACLYLYRGPVRALRGGNFDFILVHTSARAWLTGFNPYVASETSQVWLKGGNDPELNPARRGSTVLLYPPSTFAVLTPFAALPWRMAGIAWVVLGTILWPLSAWAAARVAGLTPSGLWGAGYWIAVLVFAPAHACIAHGQTAIAAVGLLALAFQQRERPCGWLRTGVLLALACCIKPQIGVLFLVYEAGRHRWKVAFTGAVVAGLIFGMSVLRMEVAHVAWWDAWRTNVQTFTRVADGDPTSVNPLRFQLVNLHYPLHTFIEGREAVGKLVALVVGAMCVAYFFVDRRRSYRRCDVISLAFVGVVSLLVVYHRAYDATLLVFALAWAFAVLSDLSEPRVLRRYAALAVASAMTLAVPGSSVLSSLRTHEKIPAWMLGTPLWEQLVMPHAAWALFGLGLVLIAARSLEGVSRIRAELSDGRRGMQE